MPTRGTTMRYGMPAKAFQLHLVLFTDKIVRHFNNVSHILPLFSMLIKPNPQTGMGSRLKYGLEPLPVGPGIVNLNRQDRDNRKLQLI